MSETGSESLEKIDEAVDEGENATGDKGMSHVRSEKFSDDVLSSDEEELEQKVLQEENKR